MFLFSSFAAEAAEVNFDMQLTIVVWNQTRFSSSKTMRTKTNRGAWQDIGAVSGPKMSHKELYAVNGCKYVRDGKMHIQIVIQELESPDLVSMQAQLNALDSSLVSRVFAMNAKADDRETVKLKMSDGTILKAHKQIIS